MRRSAFTLLELSIVLVIIGLITGGVIAGKSLIEAAQLQAVISEVNQMKVAIQTFQMKYDDIPGDMTNAWDYWGLDCAANANTCNGNGDGSMAHDDEFMAWRHLNLAGVLPGSYTGLVISGVRVIIGENVPASSMEGGGYAFHVSSDDVGNSILAGTIDDRRIIGPLFTPAQASAIDTKMDDGKAWYGRVESYNGLGASHCTYADYHANPGAYRFSYDTPQCRMLFDLD